MYEFTTDWFSGNIEVWKKLLVDYVAKPDLRFLEVGSWEGRSSTWLLDNVLTKPSSRIVCIDTWEGSSEHTGIDMRLVEDRFDKNLALHGDKVIKMKGHSSELLKSISSKSHDVIYIDGAHEAQQVLVDVVLAWQILKSGGLMICDDYVSVANGAPGPRVAIDAFLSVYAPCVTTLYQGWQLAIQKS